MHNLKNEYIYFLAVKTLNILNVFLTIFLNKLFLSNFWSVHLSFIPTVTSSWFFNNGIGILINEAIDQTITILMIDSAQHLTQGLTVLLYFFQWVLVLLIGIFLMLFIKMFFLLLVLIIGLFCFLNQTLLLLNSSLILLINFSFKFICLFFFLLIKLFSCFLPGFFQSYLLFSLNFMC